MQEMTYVLICVEFKKTKHIRKVFSKETLMLVSLDSDAGML